MNQFGRYQIQRELGRGGMAVVYLAFDPEFNRQVALKVLSTQQADDSPMYQRFLHEARTVAKLEHPSIVPAYDFGQHNGMPYIVMRNMPGGSLEDRLRQGPLQPAEANVVLQRLARGLSKAHSNAIVHRDLKPGNILFDEDGQAYLADFGIARIVEGTQTTSVIGTPQYMAPEQVEGKSLDARTDIYQLGAVLYEMLTGEVPFQAPTPAALFYQHVHTPLPPMRSRRADLPEALDTVIQAAMAKSAEKRYDSADALAQAFAAAMQGQPIPIPTTPKPRPNPVKQAQRRQRILQLLIGTVALLFLVFAWRFFRPDSTVLVNEAGTTAPVVATEIIVAGEPSLQAVETTVVQATSTTRSIPATSTPPPPTATPTEEPTATEVPVGEIEHLVAAGEILGAIAERYGVPIEDLIAANDIENPSIIIPGTTLFIPIGGVEPAAVPSPVAPAPAQSLGDGSFGNGQHLETLRASAPPLIDGILDEWDVAIGASSSYIVYQDTVSRADILAEWQFAWDDQNLYVAVWVEDDLLLQTANAAIFHQDSLELQIDANINNGAGQLSTDTFQILMRPGNFADDQPTAGVVTANASGQIGDVLTTATVLAVQNTDVGYALEAQIPWGELNIVPQMGLKVGLAANVVDIDTPGSTNQEWLLSNMPARSLFRPGTWGSMTLWDSAEQIPVRPSFSNLRFCDIPCDEPGANWVDSYPEGTSKLYAAWDYDNMALGTLYGRAWYVDDIEWVSYQNCAWSGPTSGTLYLPPLTEPEGFLSDRWRLDIFLNDRVELSGSFDVLGTNSYLAAAGLIACPDDN